MRTKWILIWWRSSFQKIPVGTFSYFSKIRVVSTFNIRTYWRKERTFYCNMKPKTIIININFFSIIRRYLWIMNYMFQVGGDLGQRTHTVPYVASIHTMYGPNHGPCHVALITVLLLYFIGPLLLVTVIRDH